MGDGMSVAAQRADEFGEKLIGGSEGLQPRDLAADMNIDAPDLDAAELGGPSIDVADREIRHAEFVAGLAGCNLFVSFGIDVGIDANGNRRTGAETERDRIQKFELGFRFDVETGNRLLERDR